MSEAAPTAAPPAGPRRRFEILKTILALLAVLLIVLIVAILLQPDEYRVQRTSTMNAPPAAAFAQVNDFHNWDRWSPWAKLDPNMKVTYDGPTSGAGAKYSWVGNDDVGEGRMTILESKPNELIRIRLEFIKPFESAADTEFTFKPEGNQIVVAWSMAGKHNFMSKAMCLFMSMDKMIGPDFEKGLASLKGVVEKKE